MQTQLRVDPDNYNHPFPYFDRPNIIGYIGLENLKYAKNVSNRMVKFNLNRHIEKAKKKLPDLDEKLDNLLNFLLLNEKRLNCSSENDFEKVKFFSYRGLLTCIACTPFEYHEPWNIVATLFKGCIYLCARETDYKISRKLNMTEHEKRCQSWGFKFEQYVLSDSPDSEPNPDVPVDETEEFSLVFKSVLSEHSIVYAAEMDGIRCDRQPVGTPPTAEQDPETVIEYLSNNQFIELKTNKHLFHTQQERMFRSFKTKKWWCQSYLAGIDTVFCGFRNDEGIVEELRIFPVKSLSFMSQTNWSPHILFNFLETFLSYVKSCFATLIKKKHGQASFMNVQSLPLMSLHFEWRPYMPVRVTNNYVYEDDPILPDWFTENYGKNVGN